MSQKLRHFGSSEEFQKYFASLNRDHWSQPAWLAGDPGIDKVLPRTDVARRWEQGEFREAPVEVFYGVKSTDENFMRFKASLAKGLADDPTFAPSVDKFGHVYGNGIRSNFNGLLNLSGFPSYPASFPIMDNTTLRSQLGLSNGWKEKWHELCYRAIIRLFYTDLQPEGVKLRRGSSSMYPNFETDIEERGEMAKRSFATTEQVGKLMLKGDFRSCWSAPYNRGGVYGGVYRRQTGDAINFLDEKDRYGFQKTSPKLREGADLAFALSSGKEGVYGEIDKSVSDEIYSKKGLPDFWRERIRVAYGGPWGINADLQPVAAAVRTRIYDLYGFTLHHTTRDQMQSKISKAKFTIAADVSDHDRLWSQHFLETKTDELLNMGYADWWCKIYNTKSKLPIFIKGVGPNIPGVLMGDPLNPTVNAGLPSGNSFTDLEGTEAMVLTYFVVQVEHTMPELIPMIKDMASATYIMDRYMKGNLDISLLDKSDDAQLMWSNPVHLPRAMALRDKMEKKEPVSPYMVITYENGGAFLGNILLFDETRDPKNVTLIGNANSFMLSQFNPEYSVPGAHIKTRSGHRRPYPGLGYRHLTDAYGTIPVYREMTDMIEHHWAKEMGGSYRAYREKMAIQDERQLAEDLSVISRNSQDIRDLTLIEAEILADPSKLEYKYTLDDVRPSIAYLLFRGVGVDHVKPWLKKVAGSNYLGD